MVSGFKVCSFDSIVYKVTDSEILSMISALVLAANQDTKPDFSSKPQMR